MRDRVRDLVFALVNLGGRSPLAVLAVAIAIFGACWAYASKLEVRSDVMELLPRDSPGFKAFEHRLQRAGGRATITVVCESPDRQANERFVDALTDALRKTMNERQRCLAACVGNRTCVDRCGGPESIAFVESGTKEARAFFEANKWLYADLKELEEADATLDHQIAIQSGLVEDLESGEARPESSLGMEKYRAKWKARADEQDSFPTGYLASSDGTQIALWIVSNGAGMGDASDDALLARVHGLVDSLDPPSFHPAMKVGLGGDIPNAKAEKDALIGEAIVATGVATILILAGIVWFYGSLWAIPLVLFPPLFGVGCAYAFATARYGYVNSSGAFLGAIILGNGVNYPIVLYSRYREFRARGMPPDVARREAVWNAFRAELVGASVASIAYGSLTVTRFRGFSQFGTIGFFGMLLVWISMIPCLPALIVVVEWIQARLPQWMRPAPPHVAEDGSRGVVSRFVGDATARWRRPIVTVAALVTLAAAWRLPAFLRDPWEYDFDKLGSKGARTTGAFQWTAKADAIVRGRKNLEGALILADKPEQVLQVKERILANDAADPKGPLIQEVITIWDYLPGTPEVQQEKLEVLTRIRERITPRVLSRMAEEDAKNLREMIPPETLGALAPKDLPSSLRRRFEEKDGTLGTPFYVDFRPGVSTNDGHVLLRLAATVDGITLPDGTRVDTASRFTVFAEMIRSLERDGPLATGVSFAAVLCVIVVATASRRGVFSVILSLVLGVVWTLGFATLLGLRLNFLNFIALPITFGIGSEYPFNIYDRSRLLGGDVTSAVKLHLGAVSLCSFTTVVGYGSLLIADNQALQSFGKLAIAGEIACVLSALILLPAVLHLLTAPRTGPPASQRVNA
ncbi:MAG: MMPL family transporter [Polyangiaceae bacterium]|nr:MMPL family transporter [Polyangiaceae bacterium]